MSHRCSIPGCRTGYKQGLKLMCYPKNPERRWAWLQSLLNKGLEPQNNRFICELHFGPEQWEKVRVDGTKKLKWKGVPNVLCPVEVELARERARAKPVQSHPGSEASPKPEKSKGDSDSKPISSSFIQTKLTATNESSSEPKSDTQPSEIDIAPVVTSKCHPNPEKSLRVRADHCYDSKEKKAPTSPAFGSKQPVTLCDSCGTCDALRKIDVKPSIVPSTIPSTLPSTLPSTVSSTPPSTSPTHSSTDTSKVLSILPSTSSSTGPSIVLSSLSSTSPSTRPSTLQSPRKSTVWSTLLPTVLPTAPSSIELPLSGPGHSIVVKLPKSRHQNSLMEDLDDVRSFLNISERSYEERLIKGLQELLKKHELLDMKIRKAEAVSLENLRLKEKLKNNESLLVENYSLKQKLQQYEQRAIVENVVLKQKVNGSNGPLTKIAKLENPAPDLAQRGSDASDVTILQWSIPLNSDENTNSFVSLDDQL